MAAYFIYLFVVATLGEHMVLWVVGIVLFFVGIYLFFAIGDKYEKGPKIAGIILAFVGIGLFFSSTFIVVPAGHVGVIYDPLSGGVQDKELSEGFYIQLPWREIIMYSIRSQAFNMHKGGDDVAVSVLTAEGLDVNVDVSVIYHLERGKSAEIHRNVGELYSDVLIKPVSRATVRDLVSTYRSEDLYTTEKRVTLQTTLTEKIRERLEPRGIEIENVLIRDIELPIQVKSSIESKITAEQDAKRMEFVLQKEQKEAERKIVEAGGVAESQKIISASLDDKLLTWFWIKSLEKQNSVIYVPIGESGLPLFKDIDAVKTQPKPVSNDS